MSIYSNRNRYKKWVSMVPKKQAFEESKVSNLGSPKTLKPLHALVFKENFGQFSCRYLSNDENKCQEIDPSRPLSMDLETPFF